MIRTICDGCAAPLPARPKQCARCKTRYCGPACQAQHWNEGGHKDLCRKIKKGGGAEKYNADQEYTEAAKVAIAACAEDTKGQTCYICTEGVERRHAKNEGLVRMCACRGTSGCAHLSCLARQAQILCDEAIDHNLNNTESWDDRWLRWHNCALCGSQYHGVVCCALGWACWKTYVTRQPVVNEARINAMAKLGGALFMGKHYSEAVVVYEAFLGVVRKKYVKNHSTIEWTLPHRSNLSYCYAHIGRIDEGLRVARCTYSQALEGWGADHGWTLHAAVKVTHCLVKKKQWPKARQLLFKYRRQEIADEDMLRVHWTCGWLLHDDDDATFDMIDQAVTLLEGVRRRSRQLLGERHVATTELDKEIGQAREKRCMAREDTLLWS